LIILTGFGSYGKYTKNLSGEVVSKFPFEYSGFQIIKKIIPVSWSQSIDIYEKLLRKTGKKPKLVILSGIHSGNKILLEKIGWNLKFGDDVENKFKFGPIKTWASPWFTSTLNLKKIYSMLEYRTEFSISYFPGFYLCNYLYYWALYISKKKYPVIFIHIPDKGNKTDIINKFKNIISIITDL
jgi:pyrrolidone-carboxylate peptidase